MKKGLDEKNNLKQATGDLMNYVEATNASTYLRSLTWIAMAIYRLYFVYLYRLFMTIFFPLVLHFQKINHTVSPDFLS